MTTPILQLKTVSLQDALAVAYAAYRINGETYRKDTNRFSTPGNKTQFDNKSLVRYYYESKQGHYVPTDFEMFEPTELDYASVEEARKWMKRYVMLGLGEIDGFKADMIREMSQDQVPVKGTGRIAFAPEFIKRDRHETSLTKTIRIEYRDSRHIEPVGEKVEGVVEFLDKRYSTQWESYNYTCVLGGNLVSFMNKYDHAVGSRMRLKAKVKSHTKNKLFSADETRLHYVKLYKV
jgi:hypothetical protein|tara:strand:+ start:2973 stop:3677 length:705 start_codon:yes stop_codon:yes gene_type:complete